MIALRPHQQQALDSIKAAIAVGQGSATGRIVMPTGAGKTFVEASAIKYQTEQGTNTRVHLVLAPRIMLANQLLKEYRDFLDIPFRAVAFHSGTHEPDYTKVKWQETATTRITVLKEEIAKARRKKQDIVVFSTYHSCHKLSNINFETIIADESQYCVAEDFNKSIQSLDGKVKLFFTATERHTASDLGRGLNNTDVYGQRLYSISPAELIKLNLIVPPRLHIMYGESHSEADSIVHEVVELAREQIALTVPDLGFSKILFAMSGTGDVKTIVDNIDVLRKEFPLHDVFTITSKTGSMVNGVAIKRGQFIQELKNRTNCLIFHYDILSEGIDVDGITGVALLRNMGLSKLLQTIGRAVRIYKPNPAAKKQAWISVPVINGNEDDKENVKYYITAIRDAGFDVSAENTVETGKPRHHGAEEDLDDAYSAYKNNFSKLFITEIFHEIEDSEFWSQVKTVATAEEKIDLMFDSLEEFA